MPEYHIPALLNESISGLNIKAGGIYVDVTYGGGGHSREILKKLKGGRLIAFDQDAEALNNRIDDNRLTLIHSNYRYIRNFLKYIEIGQVDGIIADLGISFHQVDELSRGFSFKGDSEIDMRMNKNAQRTAASLLNELDENKLTKLFREYGELSNAWNIVKAIIEFRKEQKFAKISQLTKVLERLAPKNSENKFYAKVFQALRIEVNNEIECLKDFLMASQKVLKPGGRLVVISYHSLEDRLVKNYIKAGNFGGEIEKDIYGNYQTPFNQVNKKVIIPDDNEIEANPRSRSAKLRIAERTK